MGEATVIFICQWFHSFLSRTNPRICIKQRALFTFIPFGWAQIKQHTAGWFAMVLGAMRLGRPWAVGRSQQDQWELALGICSDTPGKSPSKRRASYLWGSFACLCFETCPFELLKWRPFLDQVWCPQTLTAPEPMPMAAAFLGSFHVLSLMGLETWAGDPVV